MSNFDRICPTTQRPKNSFDQILTSWFLDAPAKRILSKHFLLTSPFSVLQAKISAGFLEHQEEIYLPVFYMGKIPPPSCQEVFLSFRKIRNEKWKYGYVLIKARILEKDHHESLYPPNEELPHD